MCGERRTDLGRLPSAALPCWRAWSCRAAPVENAVVHRE